MREAWQGGLALKDSATSQLRFIAATDVDGQGVPLSPSGLGGACQPLQLSVTLDPRASSSGRKTLAQALQRCGASVKCLEVNGELSLYSKELSDSLLGLLPSVTDLRLDLSSDAPSAPAGTDSPTGSRSGSPSSSRSSSPSGEGAASAVKTASRVVLALGPRLGSLKLKLPTAIDADWQGLAQAVTACHGLQRLELGGPPEDNGEFRAALIPVVARLSGLTHLSLSRLWGAEPQQQGGASPEALTALQPLTALCGLRTLRLGLHRLTFGVSFQDAAVAASALLAITAPMSHLRTLDVGDMYLTFEACHTIAVQHPHLLELAVGGFASTLSVQLPPSIRLLRFPYGQQLMPYKRLDPYRLCELAALADSATTVTPAAPASAGDHGGPGSPTSATAHAPTRLRLQLGDIETDGPSALPCVSLEGSLRRIMVPRRLGSFTLTEERPAIELGLVMGQLRALVRLLRGPGASDSPGGCHADAHAHSHVQGQGQGHGQGQAHGQGQERGQVHGAQAAGQGPCTGPGAGAGSSHGGGHGSDEGKGEGPHAHAHAHPHPHPQQAAEVQKPPPSQQQPQQQRALSLGTYHDAVPIRGPHGAWLYELAPLGGCLRMLELSQLELAEGDLAVVVEATPGLEVLRLVFCELASPACLSELAPLRRMDRMLVQQYGLERLLRAEGAEEALRTLAMSTPKGMARTLSLQPRDAGVEHLWAHAQAQAQSGAHAKAGALQGQELQAAYARTDWVVAEAQVWEMLQRLYAEAAAQGLTVDFLLGSPFASLV
ncbi:hypothetical protein HYH03_006051 [Edaphochlamys debaryana]|uniref:Uncharacterized protein n=1 Tax=Edaphochlamys debaryana TaxID=47281 RepID=A0A835Y611_9CHLO|nr:hypothetical protein HYH03_006051 [Edaphochlamys debaryana]|eukprot:KAG2495809.1 hypothetical protein HYH03_006051 [Edaphochlamys debaryana]